METSARDSRIQTVCLIILSAIGVAAALYWLKPVLVPFVLALFLVIGLTPVVNFLMRTLRVPRILAVLISLVLGVLVLAVLGAVVSGSVRDLAANAQTYQDRMEELLDRGVELLPLERVGIEKEQFLQQFSQISGGAMRDLLVRTGSTLANVVSNGVLVLIFFCFLLFGHSGLTVTPGSYWSDMEAKVRRYIVVKLIVSTATGILVGFVLWMFNVELAVMFGVLAFLLNFIPNIGSALAVLLPVPMLLVSPTMSVGSGILAIVLIGAVEFAIGNVIEPRVMGKSFDLHPIVVLMALIFWGMLWGIIGMFLATPIIAIARILLHKHEMSRPLAELLSGRMTLGDDK